MSLAKERLIFDTTAAADSDNVGSYLRSSDGTLLTHQTVGGVEALDVYTTASYAEDTAHGAGDIGNYILSIRDDGAGEATPAAGGAGAEGDYQSLFTDAFGGLWIAGSHTEDVAHTTGERGVMALAVRRDADTTLVDTDGDYAPLQVDAAGALKTSASVTINSEYAEDSAHTSTDVGNFILAVRNDALAALAGTDGDYAPVQVDAPGAVYVNAAPQTAEAHSQNTISGVLESIVSSPLANRRKMIIQNVSTGAAAALFVGGASVTTADGIRISAGASVTLDIGENITLSGITAGAAADIRVLELS